MEVDQTNQFQLEKKKKKRNRDIVNSSETVAISNVVEEHAEPVKEKKKKKKQKIIEEEGNQPIPDEVVEAPPQEFSVENKKKKKNKNIESETSEQQHQNGNSLRKDFYKEHSSHSKFTAEEVNKFRSDKQMLISFIQSGTKTESEPHKFTDEPDEYADLKPIRKFDELVLPDPSMNTCCKKFSSPTPIQSQCWPFVLSGNDLIGIAETGSGKTLAFVIPALVHIKDQRPLEKGDGPIVLILSPTRELAIQTFEVCQEAGTSCGVRSACFYGGVGKDSQYQDIRKRIHILVATPGRLLDLMSEGVLNLRRVTYLVLDEADRMLDNGFEPAVRSIMKEISKERQTIMFSATWPTAIQNLANSFLTNPVRVTIGSTELAANRRVAQTVEVMQGYQKNKRLLELIREYHKSRTNRILIFVLYKREAPSVEQLLLTNGYKAAAIHGDMNQAQRIRALQSFKDGTSPLLVATDVAARGLDIPDVEHVINYTFPLTVEEYVHRIGRTGRAGKSGNSYTFFTENDKQRAGELCAVLQDADAKVPDELRQLSSYGTAKKQHSLYGAHYKEDNTNKPMPKSSHVKFDDDE